MNQAPPSTIQSKFRRLCTGFGLAVISIFAVTGCTKSERDLSDSISQRIEESKTKTDELRKAMKYLQQMTPVNAQNASPEIRMELNSWLQTANVESLSYSPPGLLKQLPQEGLAFLGCSNPVELNFALWDVDYLYECRLANALSNWIINFPIRDNLFAPIVAAKKEKLSTDDAIRFEEAFKLFDWTIRNIALENEGSSQVTEKVDDPRLPLNDLGIGYGYLPWEALLFGHGDFIERGRVFTALARQRGIDTFWISVGAQPGEPGKLFAIGVLLGGDVYVFEPKLGLPLVNPDTREFATLKEAQENERTLRRLDLAGQFDYGFDASALNSIQLLIDVPPAGTTARMKLLESSLLGEERMKVFVDLNELQKRLESSIPNASAQLWQTPMLAQLQAASIRERLLNMTPFTIQYMTRHGVWLLPTPASQGRFKHLLGHFENTMDERGALATYMDSRVDDASLAKLAYDPDVQRELQVVKDPNETREQFDMRIQQAQFVFGRAKLDVSFALGQLHFDRGNYEAAEKWFSDRVVKDARAADLHPAAWYTLGRTYQEQGNLEKAEEAFTKGASPQEAGNRLRLRYLKSLNEPAA